MKEDDLPEPEGLREQDDPEEIVNPYSMQPILPPTLKRLILGFGVLCALGTIDVLVAQEPVQDTSSQVKAPSSISLFAGTGYGSDLMYTVSSLSDHQPFVSSDVMIAWKRSLWAAATLYHLPGINITIPLYDLSAGFRHTFNKYFDVAISISSYQSANNLDDPYFGSFHFMRISGGFDWQWVYTRATLGNILGEQAGIYFYLRNSRFFATPDLGTSASYFSFDPNINILFGNSTQIVPVQRPHRPGQGNPNLPHQGTTTTKDVFGWLQMEISVPTAFNYQKLTIEAEPLYLIPLQNQEDINTNKGFHFFINMIFRIL
ncbi:MAG: hypothetical protein ACK4VN_09575 [Bacteroidales bacterium]